MVKTTIAALGPTICVDASGNEELVPALGDGTAKPGDLCTIDPTTGRVVQSDVGAEEDFIGILKEHPLLGTDTAITTDLPCTLIVPKSGRRYRVRMADQGATRKAGNSMTFSSTAGAVTDATTLILGKVGYLSKGVVDDDTVCELRWA